MTPRRQARRVLRPAMAAGALLTLSLLAPTRALARDSPPAVAIDARGINDRDFAQLGIVNLTSRLALRLTQAGYAVIALEHRPLIAIFLRVPASRPARARRARCASSSPRPARRGGGGCSARAATWAPFTSR